MWAWYFWAPCAALAGAAAAFLSSWGSLDRIECKDPGSDSTDVSVGIARVGRKTLDRTLQLSSELVPFQEIDVYAKDSGVVQDLRVDCGTQVQAGHVMAWAKIPAACYSRG